MAQEVIYNSKILKGQFTEITILLMRKCGNRGIFRKIKIENFPNPEIKKLGYFGKKQKKNGHFIVSRTLKLL